MIQLLKRMRRREALMALLCAVLVVGQVYFDLRLPDYITELTKLTTVIIGMKRKIRKMIPNGLGTQS